ncbi:MAG: aminotransferase class V-fold PLP-dependent enzyme [Thermoleophilia bacterium]|nr:aminotransferase class V-fold PLP-dependent enzyme [Thermoleophilia bacterium]
MYLDNAASSCPKPPEVIKAVDECLREYCANPGRGAHRIAVAAARIIYRSREKAAKLLGAEDSANIIFTQNATDALNLAMYGLLGPGDHVVSTTVEHNAVIRPLWVLAQSGVEVFLVASDNAGRIEPGDVIGALKPETRLVVLTHASNVTGAIQPVEEIAAALAERDVPLLVDAAQSAGSIAYDLRETPIGMIACTGHKSLMGPQGIGFLYISPEIELLSIRQGGTGTRSEVSQDELARPDRYEPGTLNTPGIAGLGAGIDFIMEAGPESLAAHKDQLAVELYDGLDAIAGVDLYGPGAGQQRGPLLSFNVGELPPSSVAATLDREYDIASRAGLHCAPGAHDAMGTRGRGAVRLSIGPFNTREDIQATVKAVAEIGAGAR